MTSSTDHGEVHEPQLLLIHFLKGSAPSMMMRYILKNRVFQESFVAFDSLCGIHPVRPHVFSPSSDSRCIFPFGSIDRRGSFW